MSWIKVNEAAKRLSCAPKTLRRRLSAAARYERDGTVASKVDGIVARKLGREWRVSEESISHAR